MLLGSTLIEVAIGIFFVYLLLSMLCSALSELLESFLKYRASDLKKGIGKLLDNKALVKELFQHPLIKALGETPSYIPARTFSLALWNLATTTASGDDVGVEKDINKIRTLIANLDNKKYADIKTALLALIDEAGTDLTKARANIEAWYNDAMDRVSGQYKRRTHWILIVLGLLAAGFLNIDTLNVARALWNNDTLRRAAVVAAENYVKTNPRAEATPQPTPTPTPAPTPPPAPSPEPAATPQQEKAAEGTAEDQTKKALKKVNDVRAELDQLGLPIGWVFAPDINDKKYKSDPALYEKNRNAYLADPRRTPDSQNGDSWFLKILGILLTGLAVSQGAPFWFDLLNKFIVVRSTIKPHEKSPEQPSKDKPKSKEGGETGTK